MCKLLSFLLILVVVISCTKGGNTPNTGGTNPPPPPPPPGGTTSGGPTITGISPLVAYQGDVITLTGTGFDADKTKDTVLIGAKLVGNGTIYFNPGTGGTTYNVGNPKTTILSATATEIKFMTDSTMNINGDDKSRFAIQVTAGPKSIFTSDTIWLKVIPTLFNMDHSDPYPLVCNGYPVFAGDSLVLYGKGLYPPVKVSIDGKLIDNNYYTPEGGISSNGHGTLTGFINIDFFGTSTPAGNCSTATLFKDITIVNADGRTARLLQRPFFPGPNTSITEVYMQNPIYKKSESNNALLTMNGYAIRNFTLFVTGRDLADNSVFSEALGGHDGDLVGTFTTTIDLGALPNPKSSAGANYQVQVKDGNGVIMGNAAFLLYN